MALLEMHYYSHALRMGVSVNVILPEGARAEEKPIGMTRPRGNTISPTGTDRSGARWTICWHNKTQKPPHTARCAGALLSGGLEGGPARY